MTTRREFLQTGAALATTSLGACSSNRDDDYADAVADTWRHTQGAVRDVPAQQRELIRYATLAPSSHNTQCWKFRPGEGRIAVLPDRDRRCPAVDPDDHHLYVSLGCATENLVQAAGAAGLHGDVAFDAAGDAIEVRFTPTQPARSALFEAIPLRQCSRVEYDGRPVAPADLRLLERAGSGDGVRVVLLTEKARWEQVLEFVMRGNTTQFADHAFMAELKSWLRFNAADALSMRDGLYAATTGNPNVPRWVGSAMLSWFITAASENQKYARQVRSSAGIAVFISERDDPAHWIEAGRCYERFALQATALGIRNAMLNQPVEVAALRPHFAELMGVSGGRPDLIVRFGYGPEVPRSLRRSVDAVLA